MRLLADENIPRSIIQWLRSEGHDTCWARTDYAGWKDSQLLRVAEEQGRILLTLDKDFLQLSLQSKTPVVAAGVVIFRPRPANLHNIRELVEFFAGASHDWRGHVSTIYRGIIERVPAGARTRE